MLDFKFIENVSTKYLLYILTGKRELEVSIFYFWKSFKKVNIDKEEEKLLGTVNLRSQPS